MQLLEAVYKPIPKLSRPLLLHNLCLERYRVLITVWRLGPASRQSHPLLSDLKELEDMPELTILPPRCAHRH